MSNARPKLPIEKDLRAAFAVVIEHSRVQRGMSQEVLAERSELSVAYISLLERGKRSLTVFSAAKLAAGFEMRVSELVQLAESKLKR